MAVVTTELHTFLGYFSFHFSLIRFIRSFDVQSQGVHGDSMRFHFHVRLCVCVFVRMEHGKGVKSPPFVVQ